MPNPARIAILERDPSDLASWLQSLPHAPSVRVFADVYEDFDALRAFAPSILFVHGEELAPEDLGALRLLGRAIPGLSTVVTSPSDREVEIAGVADAIGAELLLRPFGIADLTAVTALAAPGGPRVSPSTFLDLARGISDEVNNPLLFAAGHLQLLEAMLDEKADASALAQLRAVREGLDRVNATMTRIRMLGEARAGRGPWKAVRPAELLRNAAGAAFGEIEVEPDLEPAELLADERLLRTAFEELAAVGSELAERARSASLELATANGSVRVRLSLHGLSVPDWQLPRAFEPYYLNRILRGTQHGLGLFLVQTIVHAHGGFATARRSAGDTVVLDLLLPRTASPPVSPD